MSVLPHAACHCFDLGALPCMEFFGFLIDLHFSLQRGIGSFMQMYNTYGSWQFSTVNSGRILFSRRKNEMSRYDVSTAPFLMRITVILRTNSEFPKGLLLLLLHCFLRRKFMGKTICLWTSKGGVDLATFDPLPLDLYGGGGHLAPCPPPLKCATAP